jgi:hypothetical protein
MIIYPYIPLFSTDEMNALNSVLTYIPFVYLLVVAMGMGLFNHVWYPVYRPYTDMTVFIINVSVFLFNKMKREVLIRNMLVYHLWNCITMAIFAVTINSIHETMFEDFVITDVSTRVGIGIFYFSAVMFFSYGFKSTQTLYVIHVLMLFVNLQRNWLLNLFVFSVSLCVCIVIQFANIEKYEVRRDKLSRDPILKTYQYLTLDIYTLSLVVPHVVGEIYLREIIKKNESDHEFFEFLNDAYDESIKEVKRVRFNIDEDEVENFINDVEKSHDPAKVRTKPV